MTKDTLGQIVFVRFLEELKIPKSIFVIGCPLTRWCQCGPSGSKNCYSADQMKEYVGKKGHALLFTKYVNQ